jgi:hypothetical protein
MTRQQNSCGVLQWMKSKTGIWVLGGCRALAPKKFAGVTHEKLVKISLDDLSSWGEGRTDFSPEFPSIDSILAQFGKKRKQPQKHSGSCQGRRGENAMGGSKTTNLFKRSFIEKDAALLVAESDPGKEI